VKIKVKLATCLERSILAPPRNPVGSTILVVLGWDETQGWRQTCSKCNPDTGHNHLLDRDR
jgi:hypothetical protein